MNRQGIDLINLSPAAAIDYEIGCSNGEWIFCRPVFRTWLTNCDIREFIINDFKLVKQFPAVQAYDGMTPFETFYDHLTKADNAEVLPSIPDEYCQFREDIPEALRSWCRIVAAYRTASFEQGCREPSRYSLWRANLLMQGLVRIQPTGFHMTNAEMEDLKIRLVNEHHEACNQTFVKIQKLAHQRSDDAIRRAARSQQCVMGMVVGAKDVNDVPQVKPRDVTMTVTEITDPELLRKIRDANNRRTAAGK